MNTAALERHIIDTVKEWQMKIGYRSEEMKLYYPDVSLAGLLELAEGWTEASLKEALQEFSKETKGAAWRRADFECERPLLCCGSGSGLHVHS
mgnify:CR=1 FL=1